MRAPGWYWVRTSLAAGAVLLAAVLVLAAITGQQSAEISRIRAQQKAQAATISTWQADVSGLAAQVAKVSTQVGSLTVPQDPLSAYNDICNVQLTNTATDLVQTYYYPCTNSAETIPQPGN